jgi:hypothetical protein
MSERRVYSCERCGVRERAGSYQAPINYANRRNVYFQESRIGLYLYTIVSRNFRK